MFEKKKKGRYTKQGQRTSPHWQERKELVRATGGSLEATSKRRI